MRKRLDFTKPVPQEIIEQCIDISQQAPTGSNAQGWRWIVVEDADKRQQLADIYRLGANEYLHTAGGSAKEAGDQQTLRVFESAIFLAENLQHIPVHVIPCLKGKPAENAPVIAMVAMMGSIYPAVWSFQLALRARGLGSCLTSLHLMNADKAAELLAIPDDIFQVALLPVAYTKGTDFKRAGRPQASTIIHWDKW